MMCVSTNFKDMKIKTKPIEYAAKTAERYRVRWQYRDGRSNGQGEAIFTKAQAEQIAAQTNSAWPEIQHWASL